MLPDHERKVITILSNFSIRMRRMPTINELKIKTGLSESDLWKALLGLAQRNAIYWEGTVHSIKVDPGWRTLL